MRLFPLKDAYKIISKQNKGLITLDEFIAFSEIARHEDHFYCILAKDELYLDAPNDPCPCGSGKKYKKCCGK